MKQFAAALVVVIAGVSAASAVSVTSVLRGGNGRTQVQLIPGDTDQRQFDFVNQNLLGPYATTASANAAVLNSSALIEVAYDSFTTETLFRMDATVTYSMQVEERLPGELALASIGDTEFYLGVFLTVDEPTPVRITGQFPQGALNGLQNYEPNVLVQPSLPGNTDFFWNAGGALAVDLLLTPGDYSIYGEVLSILGDLSNEAGAASVSGSFDVSYQLEILPEPTSGVLMVGLLSVGALRRR